MSQKKSRSNYAMYILLTLIPVVIFTLVIIGSQENFRTPAQREIQPSRHQTSSVRPVTPQAAVPEETEPQTVMFFTRTNHRGIDTRNFFSFLKDDSSDNPPFLYRIHRKSPSAGPTETENLFNRLSQYGPEIVVIETILHYKNKRQLSIQDELAKSEHSLWMQSLMKNAAGDIVKIAQDFQEKYPNIRFMATGMGVGSDIIIQAIDQGLPDLERIILWYPTLALLKNSEFVWTLRWGLYDKENVTVITLRTDPTMPELSQLHRDYPRLFHLNIIEPHPDRIERGKRERIDIPDLPSAPNL